MPYLGGLGLFFCFFASPRRANGDLKWILIVGIVGLWFSFGANLGASQILYHVPVLNNFRRPARFLILLVLAMAVLSAHGYQRWLGNPKGQKPARWVSVAALILAGSLGAIRFFPEAMTALLNLVQTFRKLDPTKDYAGKISALLGRGALDFVFVAVSAAAIGFYSQLKTFASFRFRLRPGLHNGRVTGIALLFIILLADLLRIHWDHFYLFPAEYYRKPPETAQVLDQATSPFWRVSHYLEYPGQQMWQMHNDPVTNFALLEREKAVLSCGIHAVFGYKHVSAHLPMMWKWDHALTPAQKSTRYLFTNQTLPVYKQDSLTLLGRFGEVSAYELVNWRPRYELASHRSSAQLKAANTSAETVGSDSGVHRSNSGIQGSDARTPGGDLVPCLEGFSGFGGLCVKEIRDAKIRVTGRLLAGDTVLVRERFNSEWRYRLDGGAWKIPEKTADHFMALPVLSDGQLAELEYSPTNFFKYVGVCVLITALLLCFFRFRKKASLAFILFWGP